MCITFSTIAQTKCAFDEKMEQYIKDNPKNAEEIRQTEEKIKNYIKAHPAGTNSPTVVYTIPVVVHVMHTGGAVGTIYNPSDANIIGAINYLNQVYAGTYAGMEPPIEGGGVVNMELQFALAQRTPSCGNTNGIDRVDASSIPNYTANGVNANGTSGCTDLELKNFARWNTADYYNIWVVNKIDGADGTSGQFIAGYAYFAGAPANVDGTVMLATQMVSGEKTLPHEIGHAFNLYHTFQGSNLNSVCPANSNCNTQGDLVCDTDPVSNNVNGSGVYSFVCRTGANVPCASTYTINTEHNFMAYTNCYTLFTNGQKTRVQAAMSLPSRASFITSLGATPCGTVINFNTSSATLTESNTGTTTGCRMYTDFTYQLTIGAGPTATATATLTYSGTGVKGLDYDVTTNGSFSSTSNVLTFNSGSTTPQSFTVRIYNDANVESSETAILNFSLNNGGGNAGIGTTSPTLTITLADNDVAPVATGSSTVQIGTLASFVTGGPFNAAIPNQRSQYIYKASELTAAGLTAGNINSFQLFDFSKLSSGSLNNFTIKMANTSVNYLVDGSATVISGMTTVHTVAALTTVAGWNTFALTTPFAWNGTSNLAIELCYTTTTSGASADQVGTYSDGGTATQGNMMFQNNIDCATSFSSVSYYGTGIKPIIQLGLAVAGTPVETAAAATKIEHIDAGSADYFYSNNNKLMTRLSGVSANLGCLTTTVENAGTTWVSFASGQRSAKVFAITPTTNGPTTSYTLSLYLDNSELGGKTAATLKIAKTSAASIAGATAGNTISVTPTITTLGSNTVFTGTFTGFSRFFLIDPAVVLPVSLLNLSVIETNKNAILQWSTLQETNNKGFEIEKSFDGINFTKIGFIDGAGTSSLVHNYSFTDKSKLTNVQYYRLKQIDFDARAVVSNTVVLKSNSREILDLLSVTNPFKTTINMLFTKPLTQSMNIELFDITGKKVFSTTRMPGTLSLIEFNVADKLNKGNYILKVTTGDQQFVKKLVKL